MTGQGSPVPRLQDIIQAIGRVRGRIAGMPLPAFEADWESQWIVEQIGMQGRIRLAFR